MSRKLIVNDGRRERELVLVGTIVVGRDPMCDVSEPDALLSRRHAEFSVDGTAIVVRDLGSRNGIYVNGARRAETRLRSGDLVQIGNLQLRYVEDTSAVGVSPELEDVDATGMIHSSAISKSPAAGSGVKPPPAAPPPGARPPKPVAASAAAKYQDNELTAFVPPPSQQGPAGLSQNARPAVASAAPPQSARTASKPSAREDDADKTSLVPGPASRPAARSESAAASAVATPPPPPTPARAAAAPASGEDSDQTRIVSPPARPAASAAPAPAAASPSATTASTVAASMIAAALPINREAHALSLAVGAIADFIGSTTSNAKAADMLTTLQQDLALAADGTPGAHANPVHATAKEIVDELNRLLARLRTASSDLT